MSIGVGLRNQHLDFFSKSSEKIDVLEIHPENFFGNGIEHHYLEKISKKYDLSFHGVTLSLGSEERVNVETLKDLKKLITKYKPKYFSEHLSWTKYKDQYFHDLLPVQYTNKKLNDFIKNITDTQNYLGMQIFIENPSTYLNLKGEIREYEFLNKLCEKTGCSILLDINNLFVNSINHKFDPCVYIDNLDLSKVKEIHLAGHTEKQIKGHSIIIDTHDDFVTDDVWDLYKYFIKKAKSSFLTIVEWDAKLPSPKKLLGEANKVKNLLLNQYG